MSTGSAISLEASEYLPIRALAAEILALAKQKGATSASVSAGITKGLSVSVRMGTVDTVEFNHSKDVSVEVYFGQRVGVATTSDTTRAALESVVQAACDIASVTTEDKYAGLADPELMAQDYPQLDLYYPWALTANQAIEKAKMCEDIARSLDPHITNSDGVSIDTDQSYHIYANSHGFSGDVLTSQHDLSCVLIASDEQQMQRDYYYTVARDANDLLSAEVVAEQAVKRTVDRLGSRKIETCQVPVIFTAEIAGSLFGHFLGAISGGVLYRKASFLLDSLDQKIFPEWIQIEEKPFLPKGLASTPFDGEGVRVQDKYIVRDGVVQTYLLSSYSARRLGMQTTANAGGVFNALVATGKDDFNGLVKKMDRGLIVTELMGHGVNLMTGDYSRGAAGFWVEHGEIQYPVEEITIAGNLRDMFMDMAAIANDVDRRKALQVGSVLINQMMVAGD